jgi:DNA-binding IclR family transcriptional regulator
LSDNSNPNHRPINVVTFLAAHPTESFTLAEIAKQLGLSKGSSHRVMTALTESGFVSRHPRHKTYSLGMTLIAIGEAALERYPGVEHVRREMSRLVAELDVGCGASAIVNDEYLLLAREGTPRSYDGLTLVGERRSVVPSMGIGQMAWRSEREIEAYMAKGDAYLSDAARRHLLASLPEIRRRGYAMAANGMGMRRLCSATVVPIGRAPGKAPVLSGLDRNTDIPLEEYQMLGPDDHRGKGVNYIAAPVFSAEGEVCLDILMSGLPVDLKAADIERYAGQLTLAAETVTKEIRGRKPGAW